MFMKQVNRADKLVVVRVSHKKVGQDKKLFFLFTALQVEEVLQDICVQPLPFAPSFLPGVTLWRGQVLPIVDIEQRFGFSGSKEAERDLFLVVRTGVKDSTDGAQILRCVLRVPGKFQVVDMPDSISSIKCEQIGLESSMIRGVFQRNDDIYIFPDLVSILQS